MKQRTASRLAWVLWGLVLLLAVPSLLLSISTPSPSVLSPSTAATATFLLAFLGSATVGALVASRQPGNAVGWILLAESITAGLLFLSSDYVAYAYADGRTGLPGIVVAAWLSNWVWVPAISLPMTFLLLLFPHGHLPSPRWRLFAWFTGLFLATATIVFALAPGRFEGLSISNPIGVDALAGLALFLDGAGFVGFLTLMVASAISLVARFRRADGLERRQIKWFAWTGTLAVLLFLAQGVLDQFGLLGFVRDLVTAVAYLLLPIGVGIAILRHGLYDIDVVISRTLLFGLLAAFITAVYVGIVVGVGAAVGSRGNLLLSIVATALIAVAFQPVRERAGHLANRLVYGKRATPYEVLSEFSDRVGGSYAADDVLARMARVVAEGTGASRADVWLRVGTDLRHAASWPVGHGRTSLRLHGEDLPDIPQADRAFPIRDTGELLGALSVAKPPREPLTPAEDKLVADLASQAGLILRNVRLIEELRASRQRLVTAQDEERRRLERDIHDGAQQQLVALAVNLRLAENLAGKEAPRVAGMLGEVRRQTQEALDDLRDLARGIYPPLLADQGLAAALYAQSRKTTTPVEVDADGVGRYPPEAEAAAYFCVLEALQNIGKYAGASKAVIRLTEEDSHLIFSISDDGSGFDPATTPRGAGLQNMADRLEALGGSVEIVSSPGAGTTVTGRIPAR